MPELQGRRNCREGLKRDGIEFTFSLFYGGRTSLVGRALGRLQSGRSCGSIPGAVSIPIPVLRDLIKLPFKRLDLRVARVTT